ncbi:MAG TPA: Uma2 family endonuclease [Intrasporangium sp.]|nr:Uma2 family endonuclease [Intrasporangium sp.]
MGAVTTLPQSRPLTWRDLEDRPDDGHRYELVDGTLVVTPAPGTRHQRCVPRLWAVLNAACPVGLEVLVAPFDVRLAEDTVLQPDVLVARTADLTERNLPVAPLLTVEVLSPSTRLIDLNLKRVRYEAAGCPSYWVVDPDLPSLQAWDLVDGAYVDAGTVEADEAFEATMPYPVTVSPDRLVV